MNNVKIDHKKPRTYTVDITPTWRESLAIYSAVLLNKKADQEAIDNAWNGIQEAGLKLDRIIATYGREMELKKI